MSTLYILPLASIEYGSTRVKPVGGHKLEYPYDSWSSTLVLRPSLALCCCFLDRDMRFPESPPPARLPREARVPLRLAVTARVLV